MKTSMIRRRSLTMRLFITVLIGSFLMNAAARTSITKTSRDNVNVNRVLVPLAVTDKVGKLPQPASVIEEINQGTQTGPSHNILSTQYDIDYDTPNDRDEVVTSPASGIAYIHHDSTAFGNHVNIDVGPADPGNPGGPRHFWVVGHNKTFLVKNGQPVEMGQPIAMEACVGTCGGDHIHFGLHSGNPQQNVIHSTSVNNALISSRDVTSGEGSFSLRRTTQFVENRRYESDNHYPSHTLTTTDWTFSNDSRFWHLGPNGGATTIGFNSPGAWILQVNSDPSIVSPLLNIQAGNFNVLEITMASQATDTLGAVYYATETSPNFSSDKVFTFDVIPGGGYHTIPVPLGGGNWQGRITRLRIDPVGNASGQAVGIQRIRLVNDAGGSPDEIGPNLSITSHTNNQTVTSSSITLSGTATDNGRGESGISSVTVNGTRASGDTATGSNTANWSRTITLSPGANAITVVATDNAPMPNTSSQTITLNLSGGGACQASSISMGQPLSASLTSSDCVLSGTSRYYDLYSFSGVAGQQIAASLDSAAFDTYLYLTNSANQVLYEDNNSGPGTNSRIAGLSDFFTLSATGTYFLRASSATDNATGAYSLSLSQCIFSISSSALEVGPGNGGVNFLMDTSSGCNWSAVSDSTSWLTTSSSGEGDGTVSYSFTANTSTSPRTGRITVGGRVHTVTQLGIGGAGNVRFSASAYSSNEGGGDVVITVIRSGGTGSGTVQYSTSNGTATAGVDYVSTSGTLFFSGSETSESFTVQILGDTAVEGNESINLSLSNHSSSLTLGNPSTATLTILDDDISPTPTPTPSPMPTPSPANTKIAFTRTVNSNQEIFVMNDDGTVQVNLTNSFASDYDPAWSPDNTRIAFVSQRDGQHEIYVMNADGSGQTNLSQNSAVDYLPAWSPDGQKILFSSDRSGIIELYTMNPNGSNPTRLTFSSGGAIGADWSKDGQKIVFMSYRDGAWNIDTMNADGSNRIGLTSGNAFKANPSWSADRTKIAYESFQEGRQEIYVMNADGSNQIRLTDLASTNQYPDWSPDGQKIVFTSDRDGYQEIYVMNTDGSNALRLTYNFSFCTEPAWQSQTIQARINFALGSNGGIASASSTTPNSQFPGYNFLPAVTIDGDRKSGVNFWRDDTASAYPDWLQIDFSGSKTISEIDVVTLQDNDQSPVEPTQAMTFTVNGITAFDVQYWTGSAWVTVPNGSVTGNNKVWRQFTFGPIATTKVRVLVNNALNTRSRIVELEAWGTAAGASSTNCALSANGGIASASSTTPNSQFPGYNFLPSVTIDGDRKSGVNFWRDDTANTYPDWLQVDFSGTRNISEIDVFTIQDNDQSPVEPTQAMTFAVNGITAFDVQYWTGSAWVTVPNGSVTGNNKVWRHFTFSPIATTKVRVLVNNALNTRSRIVELEAWTSTNYASASSGATASASSTTPNSQFPGYNFLPSVTIDGDRKSGVNFWRDDTANAYPDWLQVDFNGSKTISEIDVFTIQDNDQSPVEPTQAMTFAVNGITAFDVQYWTGSAWITVPNGSVTGNNKVWRQFTFNPITTSKVRVLVNNALNTRSRIVELEAY